MHQRTYLRLREQAEAAEAITSSVIFPNIPRTSTRSSKPSANSRHISGEAAEPTIPRLSRRIGALVRPGSDRDLAELYPNAFVVYEARRRPLKIGIRDDIAARVNGAIEPHELSLALGRVLPCHRQALTRAI